MKLAFLILTHKNPDDVFIKLLDFLSKFPHSIIVVHHDYSQSTFDESLIHKYQLNMVTPYHKTKWGHISKINAIAAAYKKLFEIAPDFDWLITLSANCFPLKSHRQIENFFSQSEYDYYMEAHELGYEYEGIYKWHYRTLFTKYLLSIPFISRQLKYYKRSIRVPINIKKTPFKNLKPYTGSDWYFINNKTAKYILNADLPEHPISIFLAKQNEAPDMNASPVEIIIQTLIKNNTELKGCNNNYRYIDWTTSKNWHPKTLSEQDWSAIKSSDALFARKLEANASLLLIEKISENLK
jgi:hypothetical protein